MKNYLIASDPGFTYSEDFYAYSDPQNRSEVSCSVGLALSPKIYHQNDRYYFSVGLDIPILEAGYFQGDGRNPRLGEWDAFAQRGDIHFLSKELRVILYIGCRLKV